MTSSQTQNATGASEVYELIVRSSPTKSQRVCFQKDETTNMTYLEFSSVPESIEESFVEGKEALHMHVKRTTISKALARAVIHGLTEKEVVVLSSMSHQACNQAVKAVAIASVRTPCFFRVLSKTISKNEADFTEVNLIVWKPTAKSGQRNVNTIFFFGTIQQMSQEQYLIRVATQLHTNCPDCTKIPQTFDSIQHAIDSFVSVIQFEGHHEMKQQSEQIPTNPLHCTVDLISDEPGIVVTSGSEPTIIRLDHSEHEVQLDTNQNKKSKKAQVFQIKS